MLAQCALLASRRLDMALQSRQYFGQQTAAPHGVARRATVHQDSVVGATCAGLHGIDLLDLVVAEPLPGSVIADLHGRESRQTWRIVIESRSSENFSQFLENFRAQLHVGQWWGSSP